MRCRPLRLALSKNSDKATFHLRKHLSLFRTRTTALAVPLTGYSRFALRVSDSGPSISVLVS